MRRFVLIGQKARASPDFSLDDVPGTSGRLDVLLRCVAAALLVSHGLRRDTIVYLVLKGGGTTPPRSVRIDGRVAEYVRPDERSLAGRVKAMLETKAEVGFAAERQGMAVADGGLAVVLADLGEGARYILDEGGNDVRDEPLELENPAFFVGDHLGFDDATRATLVAEESRPIRVGPVSVHADDAIALVSNELDRRALG
jgi:tRNA (pseudouridine54-N1)-methyltransferase